MCLKEEEIREKRGETCVLLNRRPLITPAAATTDRHSAFVRLAGRRWRTPRTAGALCCFGDSGEM